MLRKLGKYRIVEKLGEGAMGTVYAAFDDALQRHVAIKTMADAVGMEPELKLRFYREARSAASLKHPNIITIHEMGEEGQTAYIVMEYLDGEDLKSLIARRAAIPLEQKVGIMAQVADALRYAHSYGIIHRDIKPGNIHVTNDGTAKVLDFGIAHMPSSDLTRSGDRLGTPVYMSPEQIRGQRAESRSDIFSCGVVAYEFLTYRHPFLDNTLKKTLDRILSQKQLKWEEDFPEAPAALRAILEKCLKKEPEERYPSMADLRQACMELLEELKRASMLMIEEIRSLLDQVRILQAGSTPPAETARLLEQGREVLAGRPKPDYATLHRLIPLLKASISPATMSQPGGLSAPPVDPAALMERVDEVRGRRSIDLDVQALLRQGSQALEQNRFLEAESKAREAERVDPADSGVANLLARIEQAKEKHRRSEEIALLLGLAEEAQEVGAAEKAAEYLEEVLRLDPSNSRAQAMTRLNGEKERGQDRIRKDGVRYPECELPPTPGEELEKTVLIANRPKKRRAWVLASAACLIFVLSALVAVRWVRSRLAIRVAGDDRLQILSVMLKGGGYDDAAGRARELLAEYPADMRVWAMLQRASQAQEQAVARAYYILARTALDEQRLDEAHNAVIQAAALDPYFAPALLMREEILRAMAAAAESQEKPDAAMQAASVQSLIDAGRLTEARAALRQMEQQFPGHPLLKKSSAQLARDRKAFPTEAVKVDPASELRQRLDELRAIGSAAFREGKYPEAIAAADQWIAAQPSSAEARALRSGSIEAQQRLRAFSEAMSARRYDAANLELAKLTEINPSDPNIAGLSRQLRARLKQATAYLSVQRLGEPASLALDGSPFGTGGVMERAVIPVGEHTLSIDGRMQKTIHVSEGQHYRFVYDLQGDELREWAAGDDAAVLKRRRLEERRTFAAIHDHFIGNCKGDLTVSGLRVEYTADREKDRWRYPFKNLELKVEGGKLIFVDVTTKQEIPVKLRLAKPGELQDFRQFWDELKGISRR